LSDKIDKIPVNTPSSNQKINETHSSNVPSDYNQQKNFPLPQSNFLLRNKNLSQQSPEEDLKISFQNSTRGLFQLPENLFSCSDKNMFEMYKPTISPISYLNNNQGLLFPNVPATNKSFNLNLENYVQKQQEVDPLFVNNTLPGFITNNLYENNNIFSNNFPVNYSCFPGHFQPFYQNQYPTFISPSNSRGVEFPNTSAKEVNIQNKILINDFSDDITNRINNTNKLLSQIEKVGQFESFQKFKYQSDLERKFSFGNQDNSGKPINPENLRNDIDSTAKENHIKNSNSFRMKKNALPKLDIDSIKSSESFKIFNESLNNPYNLEAAENMINHHITSNNGRSSLNISPIENMNLHEQSHYDNKEKIKERSNKNNLSVKEMNAFKFNISPKSAFLMTKKN
jgi:hypothetical protein